MSDPIASAVADIRVVFSTQLNQLSQLAARVDQSLRLQEQRWWMMPELLGWSGDIFDLDGMAQPFNRSQNHQDFIDAISGGGATGVVGDMMVSQGQGEWLAQYERAFRVRHQSRPRSDLLAAGRRMGHGLGTGVLQMGVMGYLQGIVQNSKA